MGVRITTSKTFKTPINFTVLDPNGKPENWSFTGEFKRLPQEELATIIENPATSDVEKLQEVMVGWKMNIIDTGEDFPWSEENFAEFCKIPKVAGITFLQYAEKVGASKAKN